MTASNTRVEVRQYVRWHDVGQPSKPVLTVAWTSVVHACRQLHWQHVYLRLPTPFLITYNNSILMPMLTQKPEIMLSGRTFFLTKSCPTHLPECQQSFLGTSATIYHIQTSGLLSTKNSQGTFFHDMPPDYISNNSFPSVSTKMLQNEVAAVIC